MGERECRLAGVAATVAATDASAGPRIEIVGERRRAHDATFRARVVAESLVPGVRVRELARRHDICTSLIYRWRREAAPRAGAMATVQLVPVRVGGEQRADPVGGPVRSVAEPDRCEIIEIELAGGVRIRVSEMISVDALRRIVGVLRG